jgi:hypothetical protein
VQCTKTVEIHAALHYVALQQRSFDVADETKVEEKIEVAAKAVADKAGESAAPVVANTPVIETKPVAKAKPVARRARKAPARPASPASSKSKGPRP